jgi:hypothetical protein
VCVCVCVYVCVCVCVCVVDFPKRSHAGVLIFLVEFYLSSLCMPICRNSPNDPFFCAHLHHITQRPELFVFFKMSVSVRVCVCVFGLRV